MDQGNKRTPQRFVGREAIVTTQCLNGWLDPFLLLFPIPLLHTCLGERLFVAYSRA